MATVYRLVGYDRKTEALATTVEIPIRLVGKAKAIAGINPEDPSIVGDWPLTKEQSLAIAKLIDREIDIVRYDYFLEPYVDAPRRRAHAS